MRALLFLILSLLPLGGAYAAEERRYFKDWLAACRDDGYCSATAYVNANSGNGTVADYVLRIGRHAQETYWEISLSTVATMGDEWSDFIFLVDGEPITFSGRAEVGAYGSINDFYLLGEKAQSLMDALVPGKELAVTFSDTTGVAQQANFPLSGMSAALLWIDEQQNRLGSERVAFAAPAGLTPTGSEQTETPVIPADLLDRRRTDPECGVLEEIANGRDIYQFPLGESMQLFILPCDAGAYNFSSTVYVYDGFSYIQQYFAEFSPTYGWTATSTLLSADFDPTTRTISSFSKGRGIGDCGSAGTWVWNEIGFTLTEFRNKEECDEEMGDFPVVYSREGGDE